MASSKERKRLMPTCQMELFSEPLEACDGRRVERNAGLVLLKSALVLKTILGSFWDRLRPTVYSSTYW